MLFKVSYVDFSESSATCARTSLNDVHILNLSQLKEVKILEENRDPVPDPPSLNLQRVNVLFERNGCLVKSPHVKSPNVKSPIVKSPKLKLGLRVVLTARRRH